MSVADGMCALAIGTDTGGSCRIPAAYNASVGYKPSTRRISTRGVYPLSSHLDSIGSVANSVSCCASADALMAGDWSGKIVPREMPGLRIGVLKTFALEGLDAEVAIAYERALKRLSKAGATLVDFVFDELLELPSLTFKGGILGAEANAVHRERLALRGAEYDPRVRTRIETGSGIGAADYISILKRRAEIIRRYKFSMQALDAVALPTVMLVPPPIQALANDPDYARINGMSLRNTTIGNFLDGCAISIPVNEPGSPPVGLMLMGCWGQDEALFSVAQAAETALQF